MSFNYKNPISPLTVLGNSSVPRENVFGTNFSVLSTGGYMEVYSLSDLYYTIPSGSTGLVEFTGNTIPIQFNKGLGTVFSPDVLTLNSDNLSSGRRKIGMLVYVIDQDQIYQYQIPNFLSLWSNVTGATGPGGPSVVFSEFGTTIKNNSPAGISFISAWTSNTIEGISGGTSTNSVWKKFVTSTFTGGTVSGNTIFTNGVTANTFSASTYLGLPSDIYITGGTFDNNTDTLTLTRSSGSSIVITGFTDYYTTGATLIGNIIYFDRNDSLSAYSVNLSALTPSFVDVFVTGGTYSAGTATFTNNTGGTFNVSGFYTGQTDNDTYITAFTYNNNVFTLSDNSGNTFNALLNQVTGLTVDGVISAVTYQNLPIDVFVTGGTYSAGTATFTNNTGGTFNILGFTTPFTGNTSGDCITDIFVSNIHSCSPLNINPLDEGNVYFGSTSAVTVDLSNNSVGIGTPTPSEKLEVSGKTKTTNFQMTSGATNGYVLISDGIGNALWSPVSGASGYSDIYTTGFTYSDNTFTLTDNSGNTLNATINDVTGLTINGDLTVTGSSFLNTITANTITNVDYIDFDITQTGTTSLPGRLFWDDNNRTLSLGMLSGVTQQIGEEQYYLVENQTSGTLLDGYVVRAAGTTGSSGKILIDYMIANGTIPAFTTMGVLTQTLLSGETGYVTSFGLVRNIDTTGAPYGETWNQGDILYVSPTILGGFTNVKPIVPNQDIIIAIVMDVGVNGSVFVRPDVYRPFKDPQLLTVAKQNADFTSIKDAVDSIVSSSSTNRYVITVGPGIFVEDEIDLTSTPYVSIVGSNIQTTLVVPSGSTQHVFKIGINNEISFLSISGASTGYAGIYCYDIGDFGQAHKISIYDCDTNVWVESNTQDTKFYGEYMDFNGTYTYGTRVVGNNGYLALANMENYFNFPTGSNITYCNYATGSGATINAFVSDNVSNGVSGTTAFYIQDGADLNVSTVTSDGNTYGIRNPNIGLPVTFDVDGASFVNGEWDLYIERNGTFGTFGGSSNHEKIFTVSQDVYWAFLDINDGEFDITRKASVTFTDGSHTDFTTLIFEGSSMGLMSGGTLTTISGTTVQADGGFGYVEKSDNSGIVRRIDWSSTTIVLSADSQNYIFINENGVLGSSGSRPISDYNIILGRVVTNSTGVEFIDLSPFDAEHTSNKYNNLFSNALGPIYATGSIVTEGSTAFTLNVSSGEYYYSTNQFTPSGGTPITFSQYYRNGTGSTWVVTATTLVNNTQYDNNGTLTGLTTGYYTKHTLYVLGENSYENYFLVLGQNEYSTLVQAENALLPTPPTYFSDAVTQIASIYVQQGSTGITEIEDIKPVIGFKAGGINASSVHGNLLGLAADDHTQYLLVNGGRAMSGNLNMGGNNILSAGTINGVTIETHATRHQFGGADPVGTVTPSANAIPYADVSGTLNNWISTASTVTFGKVKTSSSSSTVVSDDDLRFLNSFTGGSYSNGTISFTNNSGGTYNVTGLTSFSGNYPQVGYFSDSDTLTGSNNFIYSGGTLQIKSTGSTSSDFPFKVRNSVDTKDSFVIDGLGQGRIRSTSFIPKFTVSYVSDIGVDKDAFIFTQNVQNSMGQAWTFDAGYNGNFEGLQISNDLTGNNQGIFTIQLNNYCFGTSMLSNDIGTNERRVLRIASGVAPTTSKTDEIKFYSADIVAGKAAPHFRTEDGDIVKLYTHSAVTTSQGIADALTSLGLLSSSTISSSTDVFVTGGTYSSGTATFTNNTGGTFNVTGFTNIYNSDGTLTGNRTVDFTGNLLQFTGTNTSTNISLAMRASSGSGNRFARITAESGTQQNKVDVSIGGVGLSSSDTGYLNEVLVDSDEVLISYFNSTGNTNTINLTNSGIYVNSQYYLPPIDGSPGQVITTDGAGVLSFQTPSSGGFTGGTVSGNTVFTQGLTATTISATTYQNLPIDPDTYVTGVTYSANTLTVNQNGGQPPITTTIGLSIKSGTVAPSSFTGTPRKYTVTFTNAYPSTSYSIGVTGSDNRVFTYESKTTTGFIINTNANASLTGNVDWQTIATGES